jgi:hypothetical protein
MHSPRKAILRIMHIVLEESFLEKCKHFWRSCSWKNAHISGGVVIRTEYSGREVILGIMCIVLEELFLEIIPTHYWRSCNKIHSTKKFVHI